MIKILSNAAEIRNSFKAKYLLTYEDFIKAHPEVIEQYAKIGVTYDEKKYSESFIWDRMPEEYTILSLDEAVNKLKATRGDVLFMSEDSSVGGSGRINLDGEIIYEFVGTANAVELAERISYEWYESYKLLMQDVYANTVLPNDLYVFDTSLEWVIVFTHDVDGFTLEEQMNSRFCKAYGIK